MTLPRGQARFHIRRRSFAYARLTRRARVIPRGFVMPNKNRVVDVIFTTVVGAVVALLLLGAVGFWGPLS